MDQELIAYLDERFRETSRQIETLREDTNRRFEQIDGRFEQIDGRFERIDSRFERVENSIRHTDVALEDLRGLIQTVAEGVVSTQEMLATFRSEVKAEFQEVRSENQRAYAALDSRISVLESRRA